MALVTDTNGCQANITISLTSGTSYKNEIIPIINANCAIANCHDGMDTTLPNLTEFATIQSLAETIKHRTSNETMPPAEQPGLKPAEIRSIACWVDDGGLNN